MFRNRTLIFLLLVLISSALTLWLEHGLKSKSPTQHKIRIVSMAPNVTDILFMLGATNELVGVSDYCRLPEGHSLPRCGGLLNPNFERVLALQPTVIFVSGRMDRVHQFANEHGVLGVSTYIEHFADLIREIRHIGQIVEKEMAAENLVKQLQARMNQIQKESQKLPHYRALVLISRETKSLRRMSTISSASFIGEMLETAHGENIFGSQNQAYFTPSRESIIALKPEIIFELRPNSDLTEAERQQIKDDWNVEASIPAVRLGRIVIGTNEFLTSPGPRMPEIADFFRQHLEKYAEEDGRILTK